MIRSRFFVNNVAVDIPGVRWVNDDQKLHGPMNISAAQVTLPGRDGELPLPATRSVGAAEWSLSMTITGTDYADFLNNKAAFEALINPVHVMITLKEVQYNAAGSVVRTLEAVAYATSPSIDAPWRSTTHGAELVYNFRIPSGMWLEPAATASLSGVGTFTLSELVGGSAPQYDINIQLVPSSASARFSISSPTSNDANLSLWGDGSLGTGTTVAIDAKNLRATQGGRDVSYMLDSGSTQLHVPPSGRVWVSTYTGISSASITSRKAWY